MDNDAISKALDGGTTTDSSKSTSSSGGDNLYNDTSIQPLDISGITMKDIGKNKEFTVFTNGNITESKLLELTTYCEKLFKLGFNYRSTGDSRRKEDEQIRNVSNSKATIYKLWSKAKANVNHHTVVSEAPTRISYQVACGLHKRFLKLKDFIRCIYARDTQVVLGAECNEPVNFILIYTECGESSFSKKFDIKKAGATWYALKIAKEANIPVFNIQSNNFKTEFVDHLKAIGALNTDQPVATQQVQPEPVKEEPKPEVKVEDPLDLPNVDDLF